MKDASIINREKVARIYPCTNGTQFITVPGDRANGDRRILIRPCAVEYPPTMEELGMWVRLKSKVEDNNYKDGLGKWFLLSFLFACATTTDTITVKELCRQFKIPERT